MLNRLGIHNIHMYADLFTVNREQVVELCQLIIEQGLKVRWTCNSRVDYVDEEMLTLMGKAGCWMISWGIESGNELILKNARKGADPKKAARALPGPRGRDQELGLFHHRPARRDRRDDPPDDRLLQEAAARSGALPRRRALPRHARSSSRSWRTAGSAKGTNWEEVDMDRSTVLDYANLKAEDLEYWQKRAWREWAFRPGPALTYLKMLATPGALKSAIEVGVRHLTWATR